MSINESTVMSKFYLLFIQSIKVPDINKKKNQMNTQAIMPPDGADKIVTSIMVCSSFDGI